jgi:hypothetical protein
MPVQSVVFERSDNWTMSQMMQFLRKNNFKDMKGVHPTETQYRWRITDPHLYKRMFSRKTKFLGKPVQIVIGIE